MNFSLKFWVDSLGTYSCRCRICPLEFFTVYRLSNNKKIQAVDSFTNVLQMNPPLIVGFTLEAKLVSSKHLIQVNLKILSRSVENMALHLLT